MLETIALISAIVFLWAVIYDIFRDARPYKPTFPPAPDGYQWRLEKQRGSARPKPGDKSPLSTLIDTNA